MLLLITNTTAPLLYTKLSQSVKAQCTLSHFIKIYVLWAKQKILFGLQNQGSTYICEVSLFLSIQYFFNAHFLNPTTKYKPTIQLLIKLDSHFDFWHSKMRSRKYFEFTCCPKCMHEMVQLTMSNLPIRRQEFHEIFGWCYIIIPLFS